MAEGPDVEFQRIFDNPVFGDHSPLVLGWTDDQLRPVVERLDPWLPDGLTDKWKLAIASCALSVVAEKKLTGRGVHYARRRGLTRYRSGIGAEIPTSRGTSSPARWTTSSAAG